MKIRIKIIFFYLLISISNQSLGSENFFSKGMDLYKNKKFEKGKELLPELILFGSWNMLNSPTESKTIMTHIIKFLTFIILK